MANLNKVLLMGNLVRDPELRYTPSGTAVCDFTIAMNRDYKSGEESKSDVSYIKIIVWAKLADNCGKYLAKGRPVFIEGRLQSRTWEATDGTKRNAVEVVAHNVQFMGKKSDKAGPSSPGKDESPRQGNEVREPAEITDGITGPDQDEQVPF